MATSGEASFKVFRMKNDQEVNITITEIEGRPTLLLMYSRLRRIKNKIVDISMARKLFRAISIQRPYLFKILKNDGKENLAFYCRDEKTYKDCVNRIDEALDNYYNKESQEMIEESFDSILIESGRLSLKYPKNEEVDVGNEYMILKSPNICKDDDDGNIYISIFDALIKTERSSPDKLLSLAYESNYKIPNFNFESKPLTITRNTSSRMSALEIPSDFNINIIDVLKLKEEISCQGGVQIDMDEIDDKKIRVVKFEEAVWVSKITSKDGNLSHLHIGDRIFAVNSTIINTISQFEEGCKNKKIILRIIRLPKAKVFAVDNEILKSSVKRDLVFCDERYGFSENEKDKWIVTELNSKTNIEMKTIQGLLSSNESAHFVILHQKSFLNILKSRRSSFVKRPSK